jgi:hypothetical protein
MLPSRADSVGPVYVAGYAIECSLKAYLQASGLPFPTSGRAGHDLRALWGAAGFSLREIGDQRGEKAFFVEGWSTDLRYETTSGSTLSGDELVGGARALTGWLQTRARRRRRRK